MIYDVICNGERIGSVDADRPKVGGNVIVEKTTYRIDDITHYGEGRHELSASLVLVRESIAPARLPEPVPVAVKAPEEPPKQRKTQRTPSAKR